MSKRIVVLAAAVYAVVLVVAGAFGFIAGTQRGAHASDIGARAAPADGQRAAAANSDAER